MDLNLIALGAIHRCALPTQVQSGKVGQRRAGGHPLAATISGVLIGARPVYALAMRVARSPRSFAQKSGELAGGALGRSRSHFGRSPSRLNLSLIAGNLTSTPGFLCEPSPTPRHEIRPPLLIAFLLRLANLRFRRGN